MYLWVVIVKSFKDHLPLPKISNHSTYNMRNKTSKEMLDDEIFYILAGRCVSSIHFLLDVLKNNWSNKLQLLIKKSSLKFVTNPPNHGIPRRPTQLLIFGYAIHEMFIFDLQNPHAHWIHVQQQNTKYMNCSSAIYVIYQQLLFDKTFI